MPPSNGERRAAEGVREPVPRRGAGGGALALGGGAQRPARARAGPAEGAPRGEGGREAGRERGGREGGRGEGRGEGWRWLERDGEGE